MKLYLVSREVEEIGIRDRLDEAGVLIAPLRAFIGAQGAHFA